MCHISPCVRVALLRWGPGFRWPMAYGAPCGGSGLYARAVADTRYGSMRGLIGSHRVPPTGFRSEPRRATVLAA
eukprot:6137143-Prymnesium_polylepis.1